MNDHPVKAERVGSVDLLRGIVMVIMALDHCRDFFGPTAFQPEDLSASTSAWFLTRWVTHFCAPVFVFLAGTSIWLSNRRRGIAAGELSRFLIVRGLWLILIELLVLGPLISYPFVFLQVIWVIGWSMILMAGLIHLPTFAVAVFGLVLIFGHNLLDGFTESPWGGSMLSWQLLHMQGFSPTPLRTIIAYPLIPWPGVMALGYCFGRILELPRERRDRLCFLFGAIAIGLFVVLRMTNIYGDSSTWSLQESGGLFNLWSFINTTKYPPSLLFLLMTLGPAIFSMPFLERIPKGLGNVFTTYGRVPFFYYMLHWFLIRVTSWCWLKWQYDTTQNLIFTSPDSWPEAYTPRLGFVYLTWLILIVLLYPICRWYGSFKSRHRDWRLLSYI